MARHCFIFLGVLHIQIKRPVKELNPVKSTTRRLKRITEKVVDSCTVWSCWKPSLLFCQKKLSNPIHFIYLFNELQWNHLFFKKTWFLPASTGRLRHTWNDRIKTKRNEYISTRVQDCTVAGARCQIQCCSSVKEAQTPQQQCALSHFLIKMVLEGWPVHQALTETTPRTQRQQ